MELLITDVGYGGAGVARTPEGVVFVPGAYAGETVEAELVSRHKRFARARLTRVLAPSPDRIAPETAVVPGMAYATLRYEAEVALKHRQLGDLLARIGGLCGLPLLPPVPSPQRRHYRNKLTLRWDGRALGYVGEDNRTVLDTPHCPLSHIEINDALAELRRGAALRRLEPGSRVVFRHTPRDGVRLGLGKPPAGELTESLAGLTLTVAADAFFQINLPCAELLLANFREAARGAETVLDLYCGCGLFGLASGAGRVFGLETSAGAVRSAARNAAALGVRADYRCAPAEELPERLPAADLWVVDPPRAGLSETVRRRILRDLPPRLVYVSCGPDTLARDLAALAPAYAIRSLRLFDFFPRTPHFETIVLLSKLNTRQHIEVELNLDELDLTSAESKATYDEIKAYVLEKHGLKVSSLYISQVKRKCGLDVGQNYNLSKKEDAKVPQCPPEKKTAIMEALKHFQMI